MHTHNSALFHVTTFLGVLILATFWHIGMAHLSQQPGLAGQIGKAGAFQL